MKLCGWDFPQNGKILDFFIHHQDSKEPIEYSDAAASLDLHGPLEVGSVHSFTRVLTAGGSGIPSGSCVVFAFPRSWTRPQTADETMPGHVTVTSGGKILDIRLSYAINLEWYIEAVLDRDLNKGECVTLTYSNAALQGFSQHTWDNWRNNMGVFVCRDDFETVMPLKPENIDRDLAIVSGLGAKVCLVVPVPVEKDEVFSLKISVLDRFNNTPLKPFTGKLSIHADMEIKGLAPEISFTADDNNFKLIPGLSCPQTGCGFVYAQGEGVTGKSNLLLCEQDVKERIFFGDIHAHTGISDGLGTVDDLYKHTKYTALSDFSAVTDHNHRENASVSRPLDKKISPQRWKETVDGAEKWNKKGEFVTLAAVEEAMGGTGHRNIYYPAPPDELFNGTSIKDLYEYLDEHAPDAVVIPHHTLEICTSTDYDPRYVPVIEIYSMWGSSEERFGTFWSKNIHRGISVIEILGKDHKLGIVGGSDNHHGKPGISAVPSRFTNMCYAGGITAVVCRELTRENIFASIRGRSTYATTGQRIILRFSINGSPMGSVLNPEKGSELKLRVFAGGTGDIRRIDIIKNGALFSVHEGSGYLEDISYTDTFQEQAYYYVRVIQADGAMAWSSPVYVG